MFLSNLQQHRLPQLDGKGLVLLVLFIIDDLHLDHLPVKEKKDPNQSSVLRSGAFTVVGKSMRSRVGGDGDAARPQLREFQLLASKVEAAGGIKATERKRKIKKNTKNLEVKRSEDTAL